MKLKLKKITCPKCEYTWKSRTRMKFVTCPNCQLKSRIEGNSVDVDDDVQEEVIQEVEEVKVEETKVESIEIKKTNPFLERLRGKI